MRLHSFHIFLPTMLAVILALVASTSLNAQPARTGTNLNTKSIPSEVLQLTEPDEVGRIRKLLVDGRKDEALGAARDYIAEVERIALPQEKQRKYYAWNAYCTVLTSHQRVDEAIQACSTAMAFDPSKWSAVNNRGTAKFVGGRFREAMADYQAALSMVDEENARVRETIQHNIALLQERL